MIRPEADYQADVICVLGGGTDKKTGLLLPRSAARMDTAIDLYEGGMAPRIMPVGGYWLLVDDTGKPRAAEATQMQDKGTEKGISPADIIIAGLQSRETIGNALFAKREQLEPNRWRKVRAVTSVTHLPRALEAFEHVLGPDYTVTGTASPEKFVIPKRLYEAVGLMMQRYVLDGTEPGDDEAIYHRLKERVPGYDNNVTGPELARNASLHAAKTAGAAIYDLCSLTKPG